MHHTENQTPTTPTPFVDCFFSLSDHGSEALRPAIANVESWISAGSTRKVKARFNEPQPRFKRHR